MQRHASPFDSQHYELAIARLVPEPTDTRAELDAALAAARAEGIAVVFVRVAETDPLRAVLDAAGYVSNDTLVTSTLDATTPGARGDEIEEHDRITDEADLAAIMAITAESIQTSHLHADPRLPMERTRSLYAAWARNDVTGRAQRTFVARRDGAVVGYLAALAAESTATIDLVAVSARLHGSGLGSALVGSFVAWARECGYVGKVGTQAQNRALALYRRHGFEPSETHFTYHLWL